jgi:4-amino-4-deoxy-L-arabinose transferase-like glycosyltransferase
MQVNRWRRLTPWAVVVLLLLAFALRVYQLGARELSFDEVASVFIAGQGPLKLFSYLRGAIREHPPFYYLLLSLWMPLAGRSEFSVRFLSVGIGLCTITAMYRLTRKAVGQPAALLATLLLVFSPFHIHESRNPRMYGLLALLSLFSIFVFARLLHWDRARWWVLFWLATGLGAFTHYYMAFVLLAEDIFLLLNWRRYRHLMLRWIAVHLALAGVVILWVVLAPGLWATIISFWQRGAASSIRWNSLARALNGLYLGFTASPNWLHLGIPLFVTACGIGVAQRLKPWLPRGHRNSGLLLGLLISVPLLVVLILPERVTGRYLATLLPSCMLAMGLALGWLAAHRPRLSLVKQVSLHAAWISLTLWVVLVNVYAYPLLYEVPRSGFRDDMEYIRAHSSPEDGLLLHGPWQWLLLTYYDPGPVGKHTIQLDGLRVRADLAEENLLTIFDAHERVWVSYGSVAPVDPDWIVARWLHEHTYQVWSRDSLVLYYASPESDLLSCLMRSVRFGDHLLLKDVAVANLEPISGGAVLVRTEWQVLRDIQGCNLVMRLELVDPIGKVVEMHEFDIGPYHVRAESWDVGETIVERRGIVVPIGTPPGDYRLRIRAFCEENEWLPEGEGTFEVEPVVRVGHSTPSVGALGALPGQDVRGTFGDILALVGYEAGGLRFTQGYPIFFDVYWQALVTPTEKYELKIQVVAGDGTVLVEQHTPLVADWSPTDRWLEGDVFYGQYAFPLPEDASPGHYQVRLAILAPDGSRLPVEGTRSYKMFGWWEREQTVSAAEIALLDVEVEALQHRYHPPPMQHRLDVVLGDDMRLLGYDLADGAVGQGDAVELTLYWQALRRMDRMYAMFNHLDDPGGTTVAQMDSWPRGGMYPTLQWLPGEVVEEHYTIAVPLDTPPGEYELRVGLYDIDSGERPVTIVDGVSVPERHVVLGVIVVGESAH